MKVWKFGSRWSDNGDPGTSIADRVFKRYNVAFAYTHAVLDARAHDLFALSNGYTVIAVGEILSEPAEIRNLSITPSEADKHDFFNDSNVCGCIVRYCWLPPEARFTYKRIGMFCHAPAIADKVEQLYRQYR